MNFERTRPEKIIVGFIRIPTAFPFAPVAYTEIRIGLAKVQYK